MPFYSLFDVGLSLVVFVLAFSNGAILAYEWKKYRRRDRFLLFWVGALFLIYIYKLPLLLLQLGVVAPSAGLASATAVALFLSVLSMPLIFYGISSIVPFRPRKRIHVFTGIGLGATLLFFCARAAGLPVVGALPARTLMFAFYLPLQLVLFASVVNLFLRAGHLFSRNSRSGLLFLIAGMASQTVLSYLYFTTLSAYPPGTWFSVLLSSENVPLLQTINILTIIVGLLLLERQCQALAALLWDSDRFDKEPAGTLVEHADS